MCKYHVDYNFFIHVSYMRNIYTHKDKLTCIPVYNYHCHTNFDVVYNAN